MVLEPVQKENETETDTDIFDLIAVVLKWKMFIIVITFIAMFGVILYSFLSLKMPAEKSYMPNYYTPKAHMLINNSSSNGSLSSLLSSSSLSGLANLAGLNTSGNSLYSDLAIYLIKSNTFLDSVVDNFHLIEKYKIVKTPRSSSRAIIKGRLSAEFDNASGVFSLSFTDTDPVFAQSVVNFAVELLEKRFTEMGLDKNKLSKENLEVNIKNCYDEILRLEKESQMLMGNVASGRSLPGGSSVMLESKRLELEINAQEAVYTQLKTQYELVKVQMASETPVFQVLEYAEVPEQKSGPSRGMLCIIITVIGFFGSVFLSFVLNAIENIKKDPVAMAKLKGSHK